MERVFRSIPFLIALALTITGGFLLAWAWESAILSSAGANSADYRILSGASVAFFGGLSAAIFSVWNTIQNIRAQRNQKLNEFRAEAYVSIWKACAGAYRVLDDATVAVADDRAITKAHKAFKEAEASTLLVSDDIATQFQEFWGLFDEAIEFRKTLQNGEDPLYLAKMRTSGEAMGGLKAEIQNAIRAL